jgi:putative PIN family toxin of toxin-antitoxin system
VKVVLDTNVLLSAAFFRGLCDEVVAHCLITPAIELVLSQYILDEFTRHATGKLGGSSDRVAAYLQELRRRCDIVVPAQVPPDACDDPDDLPVLGTAVAARAGVLVTGDKALLKLASYEGIDILAPRAFHERMNRGV